MICGILHFKKNLGPQDIENLFPNFSVMTVEGSFGLGFIKPELRTLGQKKSGIFTSEDMVIAVSGNIFNYRELSKVEFLENSAQYACLVYEMYKKEGIASFSRLNGNFMIAIWEKKLQRLLLVRDQLGIEPVYYFWDGQMLVFGPDLQCLQRVPHFRKQINYNGLYTYLLFNYIPTPETILKNVYKLPAGHYLECSNGRVRGQRYWYLSFKQKAFDDERACAETLLELLRKAVSVRLEDGRAGAFLSGGMDSSTVVGLMSSLLNEPIRTFSFRCRGKSFDESHYAQIVANAFGSQHHLIEFPPEKVTAIITMVEKMPEPFCDIGIEVASYLLGEAAAGKIDYVLSGDGGDELFAGHPVYIADKVANTIERIPQRIHKPIINLLRLLPDTDKKKSLTVKAKRFSYSFNFPKELHSNRWRIYYTLKELQGLCSPELWRNLKDNQPLQQIASYYQEADGEDYLSKALYGDYVTVVNFYLSRMALLRTFNIDPRFPMLDVQLVEFAAHLPSTFKIKGRSDSKYILKKTMENILPYEIVYRKDKLGHSVPMKNWIRESPVVKELILDTLSESAVKRRGYFNYNFIQKLMDEHLQKTHNHSHRLWALTVLELWLQKKGV